MLPGLAHAFPDLGAHLICHRTAHPSQPLASKALVFPCVRSVCGYLVAIFLSRPCILHRLAFFALNFWSGVGLTYLFATGLLALFASWHSIAEMEAFPCLPAIGLLFTFLRMIFAIQGTILREWLRTLHQDAVLIQLPALALTLHFRRLGLRSTC